MEEKRKSKRYKRENEITITIACDMENYPAKKILYNLSKDISDTGIQIQVNHFLPVNSHVHIKIKCDDPPQLIEALGKVKWIRSTFADERYEAGLEILYIHPPEEG